ncbi:hypothetical protein [Caenispirillum salinarum]|uniref:hypothetical protein n=1 Tax=Caenispirillum salinarum TaxID=859058 RepID=UPI00384D6109
MEALTGTTLVLRSGSSTETLFLSPDGRAGVVAEGRDWKQMGAAEQWYVNADNDLCIRDRYMVHLKKLEGGTPRTFHQGGWCLEIAEISDGAIFIAWGGRIYYRGKAFEGDTLNMAAREEELTRYYNYWDTN